MHIVPAGLGAPVALAAVMAMLGGCATPPPASDPEALADYQQTNDPAEPANRLIYRINDTIDRYTLEPLARGYRAITPEPVRQGIHNVLNNITSPVVLTNDMLQGKPARAGDTFMRFVINTTAGVGGVFDVAASSGYPVHDSGFGTTLALWGADGGPYLFLPLLGPSNPRDATGLGGDIALDPLTWIDGGSGLTIANYSRFGLGALDQRERALDPIDEIRKTALDPYATLRSLTRQHRAAVIEAARNDNRATVPVWFDVPAAATP